MIDGLNQGSRYLAAVALDEEIAHDIVNSEHYAEEQSKVSGPSLIGYSYLNEQLSILIDSVQANTTATINAAGGKSKPPKPVQRPTTAIDKAKEQRSKNDQSSLISEFTTTN